MLSFHEISNSLPNFALIAAVASDRAIGYQNDLPWSSNTIPTDMRFFELCTQYVNHTAPILFPNINSPLIFSKPNNVVIMGRATWESVPKSFRPFKNRFCIVVSRNPLFKLEIKDESLRFCTHLTSSFEQALELSATLVSPIGSVYVIGGSHIYQEAIVHPNCQTMFLTELFTHPPFIADTYFPEYKGVSHGWDQATNITGDVLRWMDKFPIPKRRFPLLSSSDIQTDNIGDFASENDIAYRFLLYKRPYKPVESEVVS